MRTDHLMSAFKIIVVGASGVGKSAMVQRLTSSEFKTDLASTVGVEVATHELNVDGKDVKLLIWDTAGQERFRSVSRAYFRNAVGAILVFDITKRDSFDEVEMWLNDIHSLSHPNAVILLAGNKSDLASEREIAVGEVNEFVAQHQLEYFETSAKDGANINEIFVRLAYEISARVQRGAISMPVLGAPRGVVASQPAEGSGCC